MHLRFCKISGAGNDFILLNAAAAAVVPDLGELALELCRRGTSVGADGLILVESSERADADVRVRFWNPDGGEFGTCGNGTRCAARFAVLDGLAAERMVIDTDDGDIEARVSGAGVALGYRVRPTVELDRSVTGGDGERKGHFVEVGIPHLVVPVDAMPEGPIEPLCRPLRSAPELGPPGANVNLVEVVDRHRIQIRTYERGVEAETLACGRGGSVRSRPSRAASRSHDEERRSSDGPLPARARRWLLPPRARGTGPRRLLGHTRSGSGCRLT